MIASVIVDDEAKSSNSLLALLRKKFPMIKVCGVATTVHEAEEMVLAFKPQLVFLDIKLEGETGFDLLNKFPDRDFEVIVTTAYGEFALAALKESALDYVMKPVSVRELSGAMDKFMRKKYRESQLEEEGVSEGGSKYKKARKLVFPVRSGFSIISTLEILYAEASGNYSLLHFVNGGSQIISKSLGDAEELLAHINFLRVHQSFLINLMYMTGYIRGKESKVVLNKSLRLDVSRRRRDDVLNALKNIEKESKR